MFIYIFPKINNCRFFTFIFTLNFIKFNIYFRYNSLLRLLTARSYRICHFNRAKKCVKIDTLIIKIYQFLKIYLLNMVCQN